jgi:predicted DNA-binding protein
VKTLGNNDPFDVPAGLLAQVRAAADEERRPSNELVREAIERYLDDREWEKLYAYGQERVQSAGLVEDDVERLIAEHRRERKGR